VLLHGGADVGGPRRYTVTRAGLRRNRVVLNTAGEDIDVCVPAGGHADVVIDVRGRTRLSPRRVVGLRVLLIQSRALGRACRAP
jgi:hypothetical protein